VGPQHLVVAINGRVRYQRRDGTVLADATLADFFASVATPQNDFFDPMVRYDAAANRFVIIAAADRNSADSAIVIAVSRTSDPTGQWNFFRFAADPDEVAWADFPKLGLNSQWIVVTANMFGNNDPGDDDALVAAAAADPVWEDAIVLACNKSALYSGAVGSCTHFATSRASTPAVIQDSSVTTEYIARQDGYSGLILLDTITGPVGSETLTPQAVTVTMPDTWSPYPPTSNFAPQSEISVGIETDSNTIGSLVYRNGSLWAAQTVYLPVDLPTRSSIQWWQITPSATVQQFGRIDDPNSQLFYAYPSLGVNKNNDVLIGYSRFSASQHPSANYSYRAGTDAPSTLGADTVLKAGETSYDKQWEGRNRWGDYSATVVDPVNDVDLWTIQEYAASPQNTWGTWWGKIVPGTSGSTCTEATAVDLGTVGTATTVRNDGCVRVRDGYPSYWGTRYMRLQTMPSGKYPVPISWSNPCALAQSTATLTSDWQNVSLGPINSSCATVIDLQGDGTGTVTLRYYAQ
jgi:hypothetical protein